MILDRVDCEEGACLVTLLARLYLLQLVVGVRDLVV